jgi:hypothetical protein
MNTRPVHVATLALFATLAVASSKAPADGAAPSASTKTTEAPAKAAASGDSAKAAPSGEAKPADADKPLSHCDMQKDGMCTENLFDDEEGKSDCDGKGGTYEKGTSCPATDALLGSCTVSGNLLGAALPMQRMFFYSVDGGRDLADAKVACSKDGPAGDTKEISYAWKDGPAASKPVTAKPGKPALKAPALPKKK